MSRIPKAGARKAQPQKLPRPIVGARSARRRIGLFGLLLRGLAAVSLGWAAGLLWFALSLRGPAPLAVRTDAVVVLTGGQGRLARGLQVLDADAAPRMLISGVAPATSAAMIAEAAGIPLSRLRTTDLGYGAVDTRSNAEETASWLRRRNATSVRVVTSAAHMRRALLELSRVLPQGVRVVPDAVPYQPGSAGVPFEYTKYLARRLAIALGLG